MYEKHKHFKKVSEEAFTYDFSPQFDKGGYAYYLKHKKVLWKVPKGLV